MAPEEYEVGKIYFSCGYLLRFRPVPVCNPFVFLGRNIFQKENDQDLYYFQEPEAYCREELNCEAAETQGEGFSDEEGDKIFVVAAEHVENFATDLVGLRLFVEKLSLEANANTVFSGIER